MLHFLTKHVSLSFHESVKVLEMAVQPSQRLLSSAFQTDFCTFFLHDEIMLNNFLHDEMKSSQLKIQ